MTDSAIRLLYAQNFAKPSISSEYAPSVNQNTYPGREAQMGCNTGHLLPGNTTVQQRRGPPGDAGKPLTALLDDHNLTLAWAVLTAAQPLSGRFVDAQSSNTKDQTRRRPFMVPPWTAALSVLEIR